MKDFAKVRSCSGPCAARGKSVDPCIDVFAGPVRLVGRWDQFGSFVARVAVPSEVRFFLRRKAVPFFAFHFSIRVLLPDGRVTAGGIGRSWTGPCAL